MLFLKIFFFLFKECEQKAVLSESLNYKIDEYAKAVLKDKPSFHVSFIMNVSPECDCWNHNDAAIVPDLGMAASFDPVALDQACADIVNAAPTLKTDNQLNQKSEHDHEHGHDCHCHEHGHDDKFRLLHPNTNWQSGLKYAEEIGMGTREYELIKI